MSSSEFQVGKSPQGKEPQDLRQRLPRSAKSHRLKKATAARRPPPVITYAVSPEVIYVNPSEFMPLVQRLTSRSSSYSPPGLRSNIAANPQRRSSRTKLEDGHGVHDLNSMNPLTDSAAAAINLTTSPILSSPPPISPSMFLPSPLSGFGGFLNEQRPSLSGNNHNSSSSSAALLKEDSHGGGDLWYRRRH